MMARMPSVEVLYTGSQSPGVNPSFLLNTHTVRGFVIILGKSSLHLQKNDTIYLRLYPFFQGYSIINNILKLMLYML